MNRYLPFILGALFICAPVLHTQTKFYNYYETGLEFLEKRDWVRAIGEFQSAVSLEFEDAARKRTYGTHFIEYYPHREMGFAYYQLEEFANARKELELSFAYDATDRAEELLRKIDPKNDPHETLRLAEEARQKQLAEEKKRTEEQLATERKKAEAAEKIRRDREAAEKLKREQEAAAIEAAASSVQPKGMLLKRIAPSYSPASVTQVGSRLSIAVAPFEGKGEAKAFADAVTHTMVTKLVNLRRFKVIEREAIERVMKEQKFQASGIVDDRTAVKLGKVTGADAIIVGSLLLSTGTGKFSARVIDVETSETIVAEEAPIEKPVMDVVEQVVENVATMIYNDLPLAEGVVVKIDNDELYIDIGSTQGIRKGSKCVVFREGDAIQHPVTGEVLGKKVTRLGELIVVQVQEKIASVKALETEQTLKVGDKVVIK
ncbi:MAG TPA: CsgG/HfaB family protein [Bacteroidota bacterium]|nr:CsgG/HfaB family protein [Bacteroidota bacterium]